MKKIALLLMLGVVLVASNANAAEGDFIIEGNVGIGTSAPSNELEVHNGNIMLKDTINTGYTVSPYKIILSSNSQDTPYLEFCGISGCARFVFDSDNGWFLLDGSGIKLQVGNAIYWGPAVNRISSPTTGNSIIHFESSINLETKTDNTGKVIIPYGNVGIGTTTPVEKLEVAGAVKIANTSSACDSSNAGAIRFESPNFWGCNGTQWIQLNN